jgi:predicted DNA-binding transcriptional regulator AlpA
MDRPHGAIATQPSQNGPFEFRDETQPRRYEMGTADGPVNLSELEAEKQGLWDARDVAAFLKVSRSWVYHQAEAGTLPCVRIGSLLRFDPRAIRGFALGGQQTAKVLPLARKAG